MGASGAGKTTLMDCLAGRKTSKKMSEFCTSRGGEVGIELKGGERGLMTNGFGSALLAQWGTVCNAPEQGPGGGEGAVGV